MTDRNHIKEAIDNINEKRLSEMKDNLQNAIAEKVDALLEEKKKDIAAKIFAE
jgi:hypothetical protein